MRPSFRVPSRSELRFRRCVSRICQSDELPSFDVTPSVAFEQAMSGGMERLHIHPSGGAATDVTAIPAGSATLTTGAFTGDGPLLTTLMRYTRPAAPAVPVVGPVIEIARSDAGGRTP